MKINRWICFPLIFVSAYILPRIFFDGISNGWIVFNMVAGATAGFITLLWSDPKARKITGKDDEEIYEVRQKRQFTLLLNRKTAFEICREAVNSVNPAKIKQSDLQNGIIKFRTRISWSSWGHIISI